MVRSKLQDWATGASRLELAIAFLAATVAAGVLNVLQAVLAKGSINHAVLVLGGAVSVILTVTVGIWFAARRYSLDLGVCFVIRDGELQRRPEVIAAMERSTRAWLPIEFADDTRSWLSRSPDDLATIAQGFSVPLGKAVGDPRVLLAVSASDASGFVLGHVLRPQLLGAEVQVMTLPTASQQWPDHRYEIGETVHRDFFAIDDPSNIDCGCVVPRGAAVVFALRSPNRNPEMVILGLLRDGLVCCRLAIHVVTTTSSMLTSQQDQAIESACFVRARARLLRAKRRDQPVDLALTVGPEVSMMIGLLMSGFCQWQVWVYAQGALAWEKRWASA